MSESSSERLTIRDLPLPAKLVVTTFLIAVGIGYFWGMAQIHFKHASPGNPMPTIPDLVARFSGVPWPLEAKPEKPADENGVAVAAKPGADAVPGVKIKTILNARCARCHMPGGEKDEYLLDTYTGISKYLTKTTEHQKGKMHAVVTGNPNRRGRGSMTSKDMVAAFFEKSLETVDGETKEWTDLTPDQRATLTPQREAERLAVLAWLEAGAPKKAYEADAFPLPSGDVFKSLADSVKTMAAPLNGDTAQKPVDKWADAKCRQLSSEALTQSTHAHLLSFSMLWALTGFVFAFSSYSYKLRCLLAPLVLIAQVLDISCWWLARLDGVGPYFALAILGTGAVVGLGLVAQITLSLFSMYGKRGRIVMALLFLAGAGAFGLTYAKVIAPQLQAEKDVAAQQAN